MEFTSRRVQIQMKKLTEIHKLNTGDTKQASGMYLLFIRLLYSLLTSRLIFFTQGIKKVRGSVDLYL